MINSDTPPDRDQQTKVPPLALSLEILDALGKAGMAIVPQTPSQKMIEAGARVLDGDGDKAAVVFKAMLRVAE